ncbi:MAG: NAD-dependent epimerase/dehydratase family protein [Methanomassiliicoccales archaeon]|nr:NAD-dependent epimerase/dehydratase family protein [Methanomassiliicoccales archaeon]
MDTTSRILVTGATGQIGSELTMALRKRYGGDTVVAGIHNRPPSEQISNTGPVEKVDLASEDSLAEVLKSYKVTQVYHLAAVLSATGEKDPRIAWRTNMDSLVNILEAGRKLHLERIFWPSSIAVFGPTSPRLDTPQDTVMLPTSMYGVSKLSGELLCNYYYNRYEIDVRSVRYPGIISSETHPGGGTTDFAVEIFYEALTKGRYTCFLREDTRLPMMYMPDCLSCAIDVMAAPADKVKRRDAYNVTAMSFTPGELTQELQRHVPELQVSYVPDHRQKIADSWPMSLDDSEARMDWGWDPKFDLPMMVEDMVRTLKPRLRR